LKRRGNYDEKPEEEEEIDSCSNGSSRNQTKENRVVAIAEAEQA